MKKWMRRGCFSVLLAGMLFLAGMTVRAEEKDTVRKGIFAGSVDLSGLGRKEAEGAVRAYVDGLKSTEITLQTTGEVQITVTAGEFGLEWANTDLVTEALGTGKSGNVIERYKIMKDLEHENLILPIELSFDPVRIRAVVEEKCTGYDQEAVSWALKREGGEFKITEGKSGYALDIDASADKIEKFFSEEWSREACVLPLEIKEEKPKGSREELESVKDVLGTYTTYYHDSDAGRAANIATGSSHIDGTLLYPGEEFSTCDAVMPFTVANGYFMAGSYESGRLVKSLGGGVCQVSTTLYDAVLLAELEVVTRYNHSMVVTYVEPAADAAVSGSGKDFVFKNNQDAPVYIESTIEGKSITVTIYGKETRDPNREIRFESEVLEVLYPPMDDIRADANQPLGYITTSGMFVGKKARLWKVVSENGVEVSRTQVNSSSYKMVPRTAVVGVATENPEAYEQIMAAIGTGSIDHVQNVLASLLPPPAPPAEEGVE